MRRGPMSLRVAWGLVTVAVCAPVLYLGSELFTHPEFFWQHSRRYSALLAAAASGAAVLAIGNFGPGARLLRRLRAPLTALSSLAILGLLIGETALRIVDPLGLSHFAEYSRYLHSRQPDDELTYRHRSNSRETFQGVELRFNEIGLRDDPVGAKPAREYRILLVGGSQVLGWGVDRAETWPVRLQQILSARQAASVRVLNAGCIGYDTAQEYRYLMRDGYPLDPDLVLLVYMDNDIEMTGENPWDPLPARPLRGEPPSRVASALLRRTRLSQLVQHWPRLGMFGRGYDPRLEAIPRDFDPAMAEEAGWRSSMDHLRRIAASAEARGVRLAVVHFDWIAFPFSEAVHRAVKAAVAPYPVAYTPDWFAGRDVRTLLVSTTDSHPNAAAHAIQAERIAEFLLAEGALQRDRPRSGRPEAP